jgi:hypothetical protein
MDTEFITHRQWDNYAKRIEKRNLRQHGSSLTFTGISRRASGFIVEIRAEGMIVYKGWRETMKAQQPNARAALNTPDTATTPLIQPTH